ncbi:MAG: SPFH domain-containing protein [Ardenticatenaceae bacterium]|nr:SPFH domain-containing protein [Ardenticatenaceae bacterium]
MSNIQRVQQVLGAINEVAQSEEFEQFRINARDFVSAREQGQTAGTEIAQMAVSLSEAAETLNRSFSKKDRKSGEAPVNVISPVVIPKDTRSYWWILGTVFFGIVGLIGIFSTSLIDGLIGNLGGDFNSSLVCFGPHYWLLLTAYTTFSAWRNTYIMVPDGSQALITRFGKLEAKVGAGRTILINPWKKVSYIVNTTKEYPYNAPIREAPTASRINASVDLFLQFKIEDPEEFIFTLGGVNGFSEKLQNAISEMTRALIYEQRAEDIYDLVGETTQSMLESLNSQFLPAVRFVNANITHAEPSSQEYRMDLAAAEVLRVAKEAYTYQYELKLRKEQDEGDLNRELAGLKEKLSETRAEIARSQAEINTAREKEVNRANAYARQLMIEAESAAKANSALLEAQALDIRAVSSAYYPEILEYRYQQDVLAKLESMAHRLPQVVNIGSKEADIDFMAIARQMMGVGDKPLYTEADVQMIRQRMKQIVARIRERAAQINQISAEDEEAIAEAIISQVDDGTLSTGNNKANKEKN